MSAGRAAVQHAVPGEAGGGAPASLVEVRGLSRAYGTRRALNGIDLKAYSGRIVGLLGPNGAGKTTTMAILATLRRADAGEIRIAGYDGRAPSRALRRVIGLVPQSIALYPTLTGAQNLELFARLHGFDRATTQARTREVLEVVGLSERADDRVATLSGGMQRRLNLACGIVHHPRVILLDEPTVGIDPQSRERILTTVRQLANDGAAVIYSTHYMEEAERLCDQVLLIDHGKVAATGTIAEVIASTGGASRITIVFKRAPPAGWLARMPEIATIIDSDESEETRDTPVRVTLSLERIADSGKVLDLAASLGIELLEFAVHPPNLSDAFMALTGHALRDSDRDSRADQV